MTTRRFDGLPSWRDYLVDVPNPMSSSALLRLPLPFCRNSSLTTPLVVLPDFRHSRRIGLGSPMRLLDARLTAPREKQNRKLPRDVGTVEPFATCRLCLRHDAHRHRRLTASAVSDRASLESACHALAIGYSLRRHRLAPLAVTGSFGCEGAAITADENNGDRQNDSEDHPERPR